VGSVTTAILATSLHEVAVAIATLSSDMLPTEKCCVLIANPVVVTEFDQQLVVAARAAAEQHDVTVVDLSEVIAPRHPLGWRKADLTATEFAEAWRRVTGLAPIAVCAQVGREHNDTINSLSKVAGAQVVNIVCTPEHFGSALARRRRQTLSVDAPAIASLLSLGHIRPVPPALLRAARRTVVSLGADPQPDWHSSYLGWWARIIRSVTRAVLRRLARRPAKPRPPRIDWATVQAQESADFTHELIAELDEEHR
jgi:hypothetical protein